MKRTDEVKKLKQALEFVVSVKNGTNINILDYTQDRNILVAFPSKTNNRSSLAIINPELVKIVNSLRISIYEELERKMSALLLKESLAYEQDLLNELVEVQAIKLKH